MSPINLFRTSNYDNGQLKLCPSHPATAGPADLNCTNGTRTLNSTATLFDALLDESDAKGERRSTLTSVPFRPTDVNGLD